MYYGMKAEDSENKKPARQGYAGGALPVMLNQKLTAGLKELSLRQGTTLYMTLLAGWAVLLARLSGQQDVVIGTPVTNRERFVNTLMVRVDLSNRPTVEDVLARVKGQVLAAQHHQKIPFEQVVELVQPTRSLPHSPLLQAMFSWQGVASPHVVSKFDITMALQDLGECVEGALEYATALFERATVERYSHYYRRLLEGMVNDARQAADRLPLLDETERRQVVYEWNQTEAEYPRERCVHELFEEQAARNPHAIAVVYEEETLSYGELNRRANQLAHSLRELRVRIGIRVVTLLQRSLDLVVAELAVLKCGAAYVPVDPTLPLERKAFMIKDSEAKVIISFADTEVPTMPTVTTVNIDKTSLADGLEGDLGAAESEATAYIMYTSGSTGQPKGVMVSHRAITRLVLNNGYLRFEANDRVAFPSNPAFDATTMEVWAPLLNGGTIVVIDQDVLLDPVKFGGALERDGVTILWLTVGLFNRYAALLGEHLASLRYLIIGGDVLDPKIVAWTLARNAPQHLLNGYGPTEGTTFSTTYEISSVPEGAFSIPIGRPIANTRVYILDRNQEPVPMGVVGELHIGGAGVALGYGNRPELTGERFVPDPFASKDGVRMYRTGDLGRWRKDGNIEFVGRNDFQVKLRGFRIELGEIETRLAECPGVREAVVIVREDLPGDKRLVAYYALSESGDAKTALGAERLRSHLSARLPEYMVPAAYVRVETFPLTSNGKLDRRALPAPEAEAYTTRSYEPPQGATESKVAEIWAGMLKLDRIGRHDNFFEMGGDSLLAITLVERLRREGIAVDVRALFATPTLAGLAANADGESRKVEIPANRIPENCEAITPQMLALVDLTQEEIDGIVATVPGGAANVQEIYPLGPLQDGILFHHLMGGEGDPYLLAGLLSFDSRMRLEAYLQAMQAVITRHDILRTAVVWESLREPVQVVWREAKLRVEEVELGEAGSFGSDGVDAAEQLYRRFDPRRYRMDLRQAPMLRVYVANDSSRGRWLMVLLLHHVVGDHTTVEVMQEEIEAYLLGQAEQLPAPLPFRNLVAEARLGVSEEDHEAFFRKMLGDVKEGTAPFGLMDVQGDGSGIEEARMELDRTLARRIRERAQKSGVSAASICHLAWALVVAKLSGQQDVVFGTVLFGRMQGGADGGRAMGLFINTLPIRLQIGEEGVKASVRRTHGVLAELLQHEHASLVLAQRSSGVLAPAPLFTALLNYTHTTQAAESLPEKGLVELRALEGMEWLRSEERSNYPIVLTVDDLGERFGLSAQTVAAIDPQRVCEYMRTALTSLVESLEAEPGKAVWKVEVLAAAEREQVLYGWNETARYFPADKSVHELYEEQVKRTPEAVAVVEEGASLSYGELNRRANRLAQHLRSLGVKPEVRVGISNELGLETVVAELAVLKAGGACLLLNPSYPTEQLRYMLEDSGACVLLTQAHLRGRWAGLPSALPVLDVNDSSAWNNQPEGNAEHAGGELSSEQLAYVAYTSDSTGQPKSIMVTHRNVVRLVRNTDYVELGSQDVMAQRSNASLDAALFEIWGALLAGGRLVQVDNQELLTPARMAEVLRQKQITTLLLTQALLNQVARDGVEVLDSLRYVFFDAEQAEARCLSKVQQGAKVEHLVQVYGATETVGYTSWHEVRRVEEGKKAPIGRPMANTRIYVLDGHGEPVAKGVKGELYIGGAGVARGYGNDAAMTGERFVPDPYTEAAGKRMYRTGDMGKWRGDGEIELLRRRDDEVKIRGYRIELGAIEARLKEYDGVEEAVVVLREDGPGEKGLVAYYTAPTRESLGAELLRAHLLVKLPEHMVPGAYVRQERLPLTVNGTVDRKALPAPEGEAFAVRGYEAPEGETETAVAQIWSEVLKVKRVGRQDNFFALGGRSLLAVQVTARVRQVLDVELTLPDILERPTLSLLAEHIINLKLNAFDSGELAQLLKEIQP